MFMSKFRLFSLIALCLILLGGTGGLTLAADERQAITYDDLINAKGSPAQPVPNNSFLGAKGSGPAQHQFAGGLALKAVEMSAKPEFNVT